MLVFIVMEGKGGGVAFCAFGDNGGSRNNAAARRISMTHPPETHCARGMRNYLQTDWNWMRQVSVRCADISKLAPAAPALAS